MRWMWMAVLALVTGCDDIKLEDLVRQPEARTRVASEPPGEHCPHGGQEVLTGLDHNDNGALDDAEVTGTEFLCLTPIPHVLVRVQAVPPGEQCPLGGQVSRAGNDTNGNGALEDSEITREAYGCTQPEPVVTRVRVPRPPASACPMAVTVVEAGPDMDGDGALDDSEARARLEVCAEARQVLSRLSPEPAGARCPAGGTQVVAGADANGDGELGEEEVSAGVYVCQLQHTYQGHYMVQSAADVAALQGISRIRGSLFVLRTGLTEAVVPGLAVVEGEVTIAGNEKLTRLELPDLRFVAASLRVTSNPVLETLMLGGSSHERVWVGEDLDVTSNLLLKSMDGLKLASPRRSVYLRNNPVLTYTLGEGGLQGVEALGDTLIVLNNDAVTSLPFPNLQRVGGSVQIEDNDSLQSLRGTGLWFIGMGFHVSDNDALQDLSGLEKLEVVAGPLSVSGNDALRSTEGLVALGHVRGLGIISNAELEWAGDLPNLRSIHVELDVRYNPKLLGLRNLGSLQSVSQVRLHDNPLLAEVSGLAKVTDLAILSVQRNGALTSLAGLTHLREVGSLSLFENPELASFGLGRLERVRDEFQVILNPKLPTCLATSLAAAVYTGQPALLRIRDNDDGATCGN
ncbi:DUF7151 family protein [Pyxidicoccus xibeiensis]|uniref:DUF7151 family protein n=1 Tax=Pyxidicoccus xibeiensis TaxID=2906759 RepID=UPI0020A7F0C7|nr:hypothetical protein [Pyxidicoccus xibeiensis]MCP3139534.1 hypothetical protein [Pyxidicoccus xibeiensis]